MKNTDKVIRKRCERDFLFFCRYFFKKRYGEKFIVNSHHFRIAKKLEEVAEGLVRRLIINMPPRYGKTEMAVICFIAWCIARDASSKFIHLSYSDDLVLDNSSQVKELVQSDEFQALWPIALRQDSKSKKKWYTADRGGLYATSAGGAVTGFGAGKTQPGFGGAIIIDDPLKPDDAESDVKRQRINARMNTTIKSRTNSRETPIILIMQRIHDDDATGFLLEGGTGEDWEHLCIPAVENGEALWPLKHTLEELEAMEKADKYTFSGQYMQQPVPDDGIYFQRDSFNWYDTLPENLNYYGSGDYAVTEGGGDFTELGVWGIHGQDIYLVDGWSGQTKSDVWIEKQIDLMARYRVQMWAGETGPIRNAIEPFLKKRMYERRTYCVMEWLSHAKNSKEANARSFQALLEAGRIHFPQQQWAVDIVNQLVRFPVGKYDDKVDMCSLFARMIADMWGAYPVEKVEKKPKDRWDKAFSNADSMYNDGDNWKTV